MLAHFEKLLINLGCADMIPEVYASASIDEGVTNAVYAIERRGKYGTRGGEPGRLLSEFWSDWYKMCHP